ncbi:MAG TPA: coproporphyrinogen dehydrogenase HemZ, partial [Ruminococcus sp.]|nr:coproporphyrinogen dehydrogenase HemZ [Ruminococcus sp.]
LLKNNYYPYYLYRQKNTVENLENIGYARKNKESLYNIYIMDEIQTILGAGCA